MKMTEKEKQEARKGMITTLSFFTGKPEEYYQKSSDEYIESEYDRLTLGGGK